MTLQFAHPMEPGRGKNPNAKVPPAHHLTDIECFFNNEKFCHFSVTGAVSRNPMIRVPLKVTGNGTLKVSYRDNKGGKWEATENVTVS